MTSAIEKSETEILHALRNRYEKDGYTFIVHPPSELVPEFLKGYQPDAIALSAKGSVVIEVKSRRTPSAEKSLAQIAERIAKHPGWKLDVFYSGNFARRLYDPPSKIEILELLNEINALRSNRHERAAYVMGWGALEAITRALRSQDDGSVPPMIPSEIIEWLAQQGYLAPAEQRLLRQSIQSRNSIVHGDISTPDAGASEILYQVLEGLARELEIDPGGLEIGGPR